MFIWANKAFEANVTFEQLDDSEGRETLDFKIGAALSTAVHSQPEFARRIEIWEERQAKKGKILKGRQMLQMIWQHYRTTDVEGALLDRDAMYTVYMKGNNLRQFRRTTLSEMS